MMGDETPSDISDSEMEDRLPSSLVLDGSGRIISGSDDLFFPPSDPLVLPDVTNLDPETQERLQALLQAAGITRAAQEGKMFADPEILRRLTSSVSCALDEAADALTRMKSSSSESESSPSNNIQIPKDQLQSCAVAAAQAAVGDASAWTVPNTAGAVEEGESLLSLACSAGYYELAQVLLAMRTNVEDRGAKGDCTPLMEAASAGHNDIVKLLIAHGANVNAQSSSGNTPLMYACAGGHKEVVQSLVAASADVEQKNENGHSPLMEAASAGHVAIAQLLVENSAVIQSQNAEFKVGLESPLTLACYKGHIDMVRFLLQVGPKAAHRQEELHTALMEASMDGHLEVASVLLEHCAPVNLPSDSFESPLTLAACGGHLDLVRLLLERGAQIEDPNDEGYTPLMEAAREGHEDVVELLIERGADINAQTDETGETALTLAACGGFRDVVELLVHRNADLDLGANSPLMEAAHEGHLDTVKYIIQAIKRLNDETITIDAATPATGDTALTYASENGHTDVCTALVEAGANIEHEADGGRTSIMKAARNGHVCTVEYLLKKGADPKKHTQANDHTALSLACANGHPDVVQLLLSSGADVSHNLKDGSNCILEASRNGHVNVVQLLLDWPAMQAKAKLAHPNPAPSTLHHIAANAVKQPPSSCEKGEQTTVDSAEFVPSNSPPKSPNAQSNSPAASAFNLAVDPQFLANLQNEHMQQTTAPPNLNSPMSLPIAMSQEQREWLLQQAQKALIKQAGEKLSTHDLQQLNEVLKQQFRQLFPTLPSSPGTPKRKTSSQSQGQTGPKDAESVKREYDMLKKLQSAAQRVVNSAQQQSEGQQSTPFGLANPPVPNSAAADAGTQTTLTLQGAIQLQQSPTDEPTANAAHLFKSMFPADGCGDGQMGVNFQVPPPPNQIISPIVAPTPVYATPNNAAAAYDAASAKTRTPPIVCPENHNQRKHPSSLDLNHATDSNHDTALTLACAGGHEELVHLLLQRGASLDHRDKKGFTPLILGATAGHSIVVETLLNQNANIEAQSERTKDTALSLACSGGRKEVVELLLKRGANKEHRNVSDYTPLSLAASGGYVQIIQLLLNFGAEINSRTGSKLGISPLMLAAMNGHTLAVKLLLERGSDINAQIETNRNTALTLACFQGRHEVVKLLLDYKANYEHRAKTGLTPLMEASSGGYVEVGRVLLDNGADPNAAPVPSSRDTALTIAADKGHQKFVDLLMQHHAQVDARNKKGCTSLWLACHGGYLETVQVLVKYGADVDAQDNRKVTPVMAAFRKGHVKVVKWLVRHVTQFPSDSECSRYITTITDKDLNCKCRQSMEVLVAAKDRQAAEANRAAATLLFELEQEEKVAATKRQAKQRQKEKKKAKKAAKKQAAVKPGVNENAKEDEDEEEEPMENGRTGKVSPSPPPPAPAPAPRAVQEDLDEEDEDEDEVVDEVEYERPPSPPKQSTKCKNDGVENDRVPSTPVTPDEPDPPSKKREMDEARAYASRTKYRRAERRSAQHRQDETNGTNYSTYRNGQYSLNAQDRNAVPRVSPIPPASARPVNGADIEWCKAGKSKSAIVSNHTSAKGKAESNKAKGDKNIVHPEDPHTPMVTGWREVRRKANKLFVASTAIARVIGRGGQNINAIREATGAHIEVEKQQPRKEQTDRLITIRGSTDATKQAVLMINGLIQEPESPVADIVKKVRDKDELALEQYTPTSANCTSTSDSMTLGKNITVQISDNSTATVQSNGKKFPDVSMWMNKSSTASVTTTAAGQASLIVTSSASQQNALPGIPQAEYSPFSTPTLNVWQQRAMMRHEGSSPGAQETRKDFASVAKQGVASSHQSNPRRPQTPVDNIVDQNKAPGYRGNVSRAATGSSGASDEGFSPPGLSVHPTGSQSAMDYYQSPTNLHTNFSASKSAFTSPAAGLGMLHRDFETLDLFTHHPSNQMHSPPPPESNFFAPITLPPNRPASATPALGIDAGALASPHPTFSSNLQRSSDNLASPLFTSSNSHHPTPLLRSSTAISRNAAAPEYQDYHKLGQASKNISISSMQTDLPEHVQNQAQEQMQQLMQHAGRMANMNMGADWGVPPPQTQQLGSLANDIAHLRMDNHSHPTNRNLAPGSRASSLLMNEWSHSQPSHMQKQQHTVYGRHPQHMYEQHQHPMGMSLGPNQGTPLDLLQEMMGAGGDQGPHPFPGIDDNVLKSAAASLIRNMVQQPSHTTSNTTSSNVGYHSSMMEHQPAHNSSMFDPQQHIYHPPPPIGMPPPQMANPWGQQFQPQQTSYNQSGAYTMPPPSSMLQPKMVVSNVMAPHRVAQPPQNQTQWTNQQGGWSSMAM